MLHLNTNPAAERKTQENQNVENNHSYEELPYIRIGVGAGYLGDIHSVDSGDDRYGGKSLFVR